MKSPFEHISGNDEVKTYLFRIIECQTIPQSFLFAGAKSASPGDFAHAFGNAIAGPADIHEYFPEGKIGMHSMESMRKFSNEVYLAPFNGQRKVFIIHEADRMLATSANALLKTFEEPAKSSVIILVSNNPSNLLPTILSRCTTVRFHGRDIEPVGSALVRFKTYQELKDAAAKIGTSLEETIEAKRTEFPDAQEKEVDGHLAMFASVKVQELFNSILSWYRDVQLIKAGGNRDFLMNPNYVPELEAFNPIPLDKVQKILADAKLSFDRFTPINMVMERVFLELDAYYPV